MYEIRITREQVHQTLEDMGFQVKLSKGLWRCYRAGRHVGLADEVFRVYFQETFEDVLECQEKGIALD